MIIKKYVPIRSTPKVKFSLTSNQKLLLAPIGDIHYGAQGFPIRLFKETVQWLLDRGAFFLGMGEAFDFSSRSQRVQMAPLRDATKKEIDVWISDQIKDLSELLSKTKGRWVGMLEGDHYWTFSDGTTSDQRLCKDLDSDFLGTSALVRISMEIKDHPEGDTIICCHHGIGMSRTQGGQLLRVEDLLKMFDADVYLMGHSHGKLLSPIDRQCITPDGVHYHRTNIIGRTGSWMRQYLSHKPLDLREPAVESRGTYAEKKAYIPASIGCPLIGIGFEKIHESKYYRPTLHYSI
jgi:hypothetical protein